MKILDKEYSMIKKDNSLKSVSESYDSLSKTKVLIFCYSYNHEKYISKCLDSMLGQRVNFNVKIIVHDDNSTDETLKIVKDYSKKYPNIIKIISQKNNLYDKSHGLLPIFLYLRDFHEGDYIAICEGDDYWTDPFKLAFQKKILEDFSNLSFCVHKVDVLDNQSNKIVRTIPSKKFKLHSGIMSSSKFIRLTSIRYPFQTSSYFFRTADFSNYLDELPEYARIMPTEDEAILLYFGQLGNVAYSDKSMSIYRKFSEGSWSNDHKNTTSEHQGNSRLKKMIDSVKSFDEYTNYRFHDSCQKRIIKHTFRILMNDNRVEEILNDKQLRNYYKSVYPRDYWSLRLRNIFRRG